MAARRGRGEGSIIQVHGPKWGCPEPIEVVNSQTGKVRKVTPKHPRCMGPWRLTVDLGVVGGKRRRVTVQRATKGDVMVERDRLLSERSSGITPDQITVDEWMQMWLDTAELKAYTRRGYESKNRTWISPHLGKVRLQKLTSTHVRAMVRAMDDAGKAPTTIRQVKAILGRALTVAERDRLVPRNVAQHVEVPRGRSTPHAIMTPEQAMAVINAAQTVREQARLVVALMAGLRQGEALGLRWGDVSLPEEDAPVQAGVIHVRRSVAFVDGEVVEQTTKSTNSDRTVHFSAAAVTALRAHRGREWHADDWVFPGPKPDKPINAWIDFDDWKRCCARVEVDVPLHGARGTLETALILSGVPVSDSAAMLGHDQVTALRHYSRVTAASQQGLGEQVDKLFTAAEPAAPEPAELSQRASLPQ